jgi:hypothetical protein
VDPSLGAKSGSGGDRVGCDGFCASGDVALEGGAVVAAVGGAAAGAAPRVVDGVLGAADGASIKMMAVRPTNPIPIATMP